MSILDNLLASWKFDESSGDAVDSSGNGYTLTNAGSVAYNAGKINNSADFGTANTTKYLISTNSVLYNAFYSSSFTISFWVKANSQPSSGVYYEILSVAPRGGSLEKDIAIYYANISGTTHLYFDKNNYGGSNARVDYAVTLTTGTWYQITCVCNYAGTNYMYINNVQVGSTADINNATGGGGTQSFCLAAHSNAQGNKASVSLDIVSLWTRAVTSGERDTFYNGGDGVQHPFIPAIKGGAGFLFLMI